MIFRGVMMFRFDPPVGMVDGVIFDTLQEYWLPLHTIAQRLPSRDSSAALVRLNRLQRMGLAESAAFGEMINGSWRLTERGVRYRRVVDASRLACVIDEWRLDDGVQWPSA